MPRFHRYGREGVQRPEPSHSGAFPTVPEADLRKILAHVWALQYRRPEGNVARGQLAFAAKGCVGCHSDAQTGAVVSPRAGKVFTPFSMAEIAWGWNQQMHRKMGNKAVPSPEDMSDLVAYLNSVSRK